MAEPGDILLVAGKGHEKYQEINGVKHDFDDLKTTIELFKKLEK
jgi:UDP-N-acetylmuramoyl-L-alanyl-D-glutamate--2,6-diaminopimelate ligase